MDNYIYTIIIPHYNVPNLLQRCLMSIPKRNDTQIIVVDDNSDKKYAKELERIESTFSNILFIYASKNGGGGYARNVGLKHALGKYVLFADADDYFTYCINEVLEDYKDCEADIIYFDAISQETDTYKVAYRARHLNLMMVRHKSHPEKAEIELRYLFGEPWCKIVKRSIIEKYQISFDEIIIHNDTKYSYMVGYYCKKMIVDRRALYCVTVRENSVSKTKSLDRLLTRTRVYGEANSFFKHHHISYFEEKALRPMMGFLLHFKFENYLKCKNVLRECGMSKTDLFLRQISYPYLLSKKVVINLKEILVRLRTLSK